MSLSRKYISVPYENRESILKELHQLGISGYEYALKMEWVDWFAHFKKSSICVYVDFRLMKLFDPITRNESLETYLSIDEFKDEFRIFLEQKKKSENVKITTKIGLLKQEISQLESLN